MALRLQHAGREVVSLTILDADAPDEDEGRVHEYDDRGALCSLIEVFELMAGVSLGLSPHHLDGASRDGNLKMLHDRLVQAGLIPRRSSLDLLRGPFRVFAACLRTTYRPASVYSGAVRLVVLNDSRIDDVVNRRRHEGSIAGWRRWAPRLVAVLGEGNHMTALKAPHAAALARRITELDHDFGA
jgi:arthrofactin-type cyclic lipopeptide synthetase C